MRFRRLPPVASFIRKVTFLWLESEKYKTDRSPKRKELIHVCFLNSRILHLGLASGGLESGGGMFWDCLTKHDAEKVRFSDQARRRS